MIHKPGDLLKSVLNEIEKRITEDINADFLAEHSGISSIHLQRLFKFAFKQSLGAYIRSRKLAASLESLLNTGSNLLDIALEYGFEYEQSYLRSFKREFGVTPGIIRRTGKIVKVTPPLNLLGTDLIGNGIMFEPEIVMVPQFYVIGRKHKIPYSDSINMAPKAGKQFWGNDRSRIPNTKEPNIYIGLTRTAGIDADYNWYLPSMQVKSLKNIPEGFDGYTFKPSLCAKFRYIGQHHYFEINRNKAKNMYSAIEKFFNCEYGCKFSRISDVYFEKIDSESYDGNFCQMEWFTPIKNKK
jgi:AraC-type DNA-binding domain-containing proteins